MSEKIKQPPIYRIEVGEITLPEGKSLVEIKRLNDFFWLVSKGDNTFFINNSTGYLFGETTTFFINDFSKKEKEINK